MLATLLTKLIEDTKMTTNTRLGQPTMPMTQLIEYRPTCKDCGEHLEGDGYTVVMHCPYADEVLYVEPDAAPIYCGWSEADDK